MIVNPKIGIIILVYNAPEYVKKCINSVKKLTEGIDYCNIVIDNNSNYFTKKVLSDLHEKKEIDILCHLESNRFFAEGNNIGVKILPKNCTHVLLLNSDVEILNEQWLKNLYNKHERGIISYGSSLNNFIKGVKIPNRSDGFCFLINKELYTKYWLDQLPSP